MIASLIAAATLLIFVAVVQRYLVGVPLLYPIFYDINLTWAQELCIYMFVWMAKFGAAYGVRTGIHVGVDVVVNMLQPKHRMKVVMFGLLCGALFYVRGRHHGRKVRDRALSDRPSLARYGNAALDHFLVRAARLIPDVLPFLAGGLDVLAHRRAAAP